MLRRTYRLKEVSALLLILLAFDVTAKLFGATHSLQRLRCPRSGRQAIELLVGGLTSRRGRSLSPLAFTPASTASPYLLCQLPSASCPSGSSSSRSDSPSLPLEFSFCFSSERKQPRSQIIAMPGAEDDDHPSGVASAEQGLEREAYSNEDDDVSHWRVPSLHSFLHSLCARDN